MPITPVGTPVLTVGGTKLPSPSEYVVTVNEITKASRNARGTLTKTHLNWKTSISVVWYAVTASDMRSIADATDSEYPMTVKYYNPETNAMKSSRFYRGSDYKVTGVDVFTWTGTGANRAPAGHRHYRVEMTLTEY